MTFLVYGSFQDLRFGPDPTILTNLAGADALQRLIHKKTYAALLLNGRAQPTRVKAALAHYHGPPVFILLDPEQLPDFAGIQAILVTDEAMLVDQVNRRLPSTAQVSRRVSPPAQVLPEIAIFPDGARVDLRLLNPVLAPLLHAVTKQAAALQQGMLVLEFFAQAGLRTHTPLDLLRQVQACLPPAWRLELSSAGGLPERRLWLLPVTTAGPERGEKVTIWGREVRLQGANLHQRDIVHQLAANPAEYWRGIPIGEVARRWGMTEGSSKNMLYQLNNFLKPVWLLLRSRGNMIELVLQNPPSSSLP